MRNLFIVLGFIAAVLALLLAVTSLSQIAYIPALAALVFGFIAFYISKRKQSPKKSVQLIFLLTIISLVLTTYKAVFNTTKIENLENLELKEDILEASDLDKIEIEATDVDTIKIEKRPLLEGLEDE